MQRMTGYRLGVVRLWLGSARVLLPSRSGSCIKPSRFILGEARQARGWQMLPQGRLCSPGGLGEGGQGGGGGGGGGIGQSGVSR